MDKKSIYSKMNQGIFSNEIELENNEFLNLDILMANLNSLDKEKEEMTEEKIFRY